MKYRDNVHAQFLIKFAYKSLLDEILQNSSTCGVLLPGKLKTQLVGVVWVEGWSLVAV